MSTEELLKEYLHAIKELEKAQNKAEISYSKYAISRAKGD